MKVIATFSIVAYDPKNQEWGVAVQSKFLGVGAVVPAAKAGIGAVATQSYANLMYGPDGLKMMDEGSAAKETIEFLTAADDGRDQRQVGMIDKNGQSFAYTGAGCSDWAGHLIGEGYACQGNILVPGTIEAMATRFEEAREGEGELADWLVESLLAGQEAGGDSRGRQSAAVLVVREGGGYGGNNDRYLDLRVDDHPMPIKELKRILAIHHLFFGKMIEGNTVPLSEVAAELQEMLTRTGNYFGKINGSFDDVTRKALLSLVGTENLEERWTGKEDEIDLEALNFLRDKFSKV